MIHNCQIKQLALTHHDKWTVCHLEELFLLALLLDVSENSYHLTFSPVVNVVCVWVFIVLTNVQWDLNALFTASKDLGCWKFTLLYLSHAPILLYSTQFILSCFLGVQFQELFLYFAISYLNAIFIMQMLCPGLWLTFYSFKAVFHIVYVVNIMEL